MCMPLTPESLYEHAMQLSDQQRAQLVVRLQQSLHHFSDSEVEADWLAEAAERLAAHRRGEPSLDGEPIMRRLRDGH